MKDRERHRVQIYNSNIMHLFAVTHTKSNGSVESSGNEQCDGVTLDVIDTSHIESASKLEQSH